MRDVKGDIEDLQKKLAGFGSSSSGTEKGNSNGYDINDIASNVSSCLLYTSPSPRDQRGSRMPSSA